MFCWAVWYTFVVEVPELIELQTDALCKYCDAGRFDVEYSWNKLQYVDSKIEEMENKIASVKVVGMKATRIVWLASVRWKDVVTVISNGCKEHKSEAFRGKSLGYVGTIWERIVSNYIPPLKIELIVKYFRTEKDWSKVCVENVDKIGENNKNQNLFLSNSTKSQSMLTFLYLLFLIFWYKKDKWSWFMARKVSLVLHPPFKNADVIFFSYVSSYCFYIHHNPPPNSASGSYPQAAAIHSSLS